jgi:hypothetical protein
MSHDAISCKICSMRHVESEQEYCELCASLLSKSKSTAWNIEVDPNTKIELLRFMDNAKQSPTRWRRISPILLMKELSWFQLPEGTDPVQELPCSEEEFAHIIELKFSNGPLTWDQEEILRRGVKLQEGSILSIQGSDCFVDHFRLTRATPIRLLFKFVCDKELRRGWNLKQFFLAASALSYNATEEFLRRHRPISAGQESFHAMLRWLGSIISCSSERTELSSGIQAWAYDVNSHYRRRGDQNFSEHYKNAIRNIPDGLEQLFPEPWFQAWNLQTNIHHQDVNQVHPLRFTLDKIKIRCRKQDGSACWVPVLEQPLHIAFVLSACFYPVDHPARELFSALQATWFSGDVDVPISETPFGVSIQFLQGCLNAAGENAIVYRSRILIIGNFGHYYELKVGHGAHGAPYRLRPLTCSGTTLRYGESLCIHNGASQRRLPLGDTFGSVVLGITNDAISSQQVDSLRHHLVRNSPLLLTPSNRMEFLERIDSPIFNQFVHQNTHYVPGHHPNERDIGTVRWFHKQEIQSVENTRQVQLHQNQYEYARWAERIFIENRRMNRNVSRDMSEGPRTTLEEFSHREAVLAWKRLVDQSLNLAVDENVATPRGIHDYIRNMRINRDPPFNQFDIYIGRDHNRVTYLHGCGDVRDGERRWCETFARVWECMHLQPIDSTLQMYTQDAQVLGFQHYGLKVTLRDGDERNFVVKMAELLGYELLVEDGQNITMIRRHPHRTEARIEIARMLNVLQQRQGAEKAPPRWWNYIDSEGEPKKAERGRWQLHEDLTDNPRAPKSRVQFEDL